MPSITGLTAAEVEARRAAGQTNQPPKSQTKTTGEIVRDNVCTYFNLVFLVLAVMLALVHSWLNMGFLGIVFWNTLIGIVQQLRVTKGVEVAMFLYEQKVQEFKVSLRSNGKVDVNEVASYFGGGGHVRAAGCTMSGSVHDVINNLSEHIDRQMKEYEA